MWRNPTPVPQSSETFPGMVVNTSNPGRCSFCLVSAGELERIPGPGRADRRPPADRQRRRGRILLRSAAARVTALPHLALGRPDRPPPPRWPDPGRTRLGRAWPGRRRRVPGRGWPPRWSGGRARAAAQLASSPPAAPVRVHPDLHISERARTSTGWSSSGRHAWTTGPTQAAPDFIVLRDPKGNEFCVIDHPEL